MSSLRSLIYSVCNVIGERINYFDPVIVGHIFLFDKNKQLRTNIFSGFAGAKRS